MTTARHDQSPPDLLRRYQPIPRLPEVPRARLEGPIHLVLGLAALAVVWLLQLAIAAFVPRAGTFVERVRETPEVLVAPHYAQRLAVPLPADAAERGLTLNQARPRVPQPSNAAVKPVI